MKSSTPSNLKPVVKQSKEELFKTHTKAIEADLNNQNKIESLIAVLLKTLLINYQNLKLKNFLKI